jgi:hypothetical protein
MSTVKQIVAIEANIVWHAKRSEMSKRWIGVCEALNLSMEADSLDELHCVIPEAIHLLMVDLMEDNELDRYLRDKRWTASSVPNQAQGEVEFNVPWELIVEGARGSERRAH